ncbi:hypothetical protein [Aerococcus urinaeequi]|uniref:hypothetical protein n=1 Tax=Aerococcus urinaeequi TaxID=51665 RepID=UPI003D6A0367
MQSVSVFNIQNNGNSFKLDDFENSWTEEINEVSETLKFELFVNEEVQGFKRIHISMDEPFAIKARVLNTEINQVIITSKFEGFYNVNSKQIIILANKKSAERIAEQIGIELKTEVLKVVFDLQKIIQNAADVKRTQFRSLQLETINGSSLTGNKVTNTEIYRMMLEAGELSNIAVLYPFDGNQVNFTISDSGSIVLLTSLDEEEIIQLILELTT